MKRVGSWLALVLAAVLLMGLLAGCGGAQTEEAAPEEPTAVEEPETAESEADQPEEADEPVPAVTAAALPEVEAAFDETVLVDNDDIAVTVTDFDPTSQWGPLFTVLLENKTERDLYFTLANVSVNDVMNDPIWGENVPAGESVTSYVYWYPEDMLSSGINYVERVDATLWVYERDDHTAQDIFEDAVSWSVTTGDTDLPATQRMVYDGSFEPIEILSGDVTAYLVDYTADDAWGPTLTIYLENNGGETVLFAMTGVSVNGALCDPYWNEDVDPGKIAYSTCGWWAEDLEALGIDGIETVEFTFLAIDYNDFNELASVTMTVSVEGTGQVIDQSGSGTVSVENDADGGQEFLLPGE